MQMTLTLGIYENSLSHNYRLKNKREYDNVID